jgi:cell division protein FtsZ
MASGIVENAARTEQIVNLLARGMTEPKIAVVGVGGAGSNTVSRLYGSMKENVQMVAINTDADNLMASTAHKKILVGGDVTQGLGTKGFPEVGEYCAECAKEAIRDSLRGNDIIMVVAGMGGGSGTGMAPVVARIAKESKAITFVVAIRPFTSEGKDRAAKADAGIEALKKVAPNMIVVENDLLLRMAGDKKMNEAFKIIDRNVMNIVDSMCAQVSSAFRVELKKEVREWVMNHQEEAAPQAMPIPVPHAKQTMEIGPSHVMGAEAKLGPDMFQK